MAERHESVAADGEPRHPHSVHAGRESLDDGMRVLKDGEGFAVFDRHGDAIAGRSSHGVYHDGTRHLSTLILSIAGARPLLLKSTIHPDNVLLAIDLTNPDVGGEVDLEADTVHVFRAKVLRAGTLHERLRITNHGQDTVRFPLSFRLAADFVDLFEVRGSQRARRGRFLEPKVTESAIRFGYVGLDDVVRLTEVACWPRPDRIGGNTIEYEVVLAPKQQVKIELAISCAGTGTGLVTGERQWFDDAYTERKTVRSQRREHGPRIRSSSTSFDRWIDRSLSDVYMMLSGTTHGEYPYAGVPWYSTVFGRDGILTAMSMLWADPEMARGVLQVLAATQADAVDAMRDAQPGKIVHELRTGEMAALGEIPFGRYYGTVDATPLFIVLAGAYLERTGDLATVRALWPHIERALGWIDANSAADPHGFITYAASLTGGLTQQGWKDSVTSVFDTGGHLVPPPIALCEVQGYVYAARRAAAAMARRLGDEARALRLDSDAEQLRARFEDIFWIEELGTYALALDGNGQPCRVITSNPGHCLWSGIVSSERARRVGETLLDPRMFSGWGVRTVADSEVRYNPMSYHNGSVWPHDTALCAAGLARYGMMDGALALLTGLYDASGFMDLHRMPELLCGFSRKDGHGPVLYPVACSPQAWSAAAPMLLLGSCLGLTIDGARGTARLVSPVLPAWIDWVTIEGLGVGDAVVDLRVVRGSDGVSVESTVRSADRRS